MAKEASAERVQPDIAFLCVNTVLAFLMTGILLLIAAAAATYFALPRSVTDVMVMVLTGFCVALAGFRAASHAGKQGLLQGVLAGVIYMAFLYLAGSLVFGDFSFRSTTLLSLLIGIGCGAIGGVFGVNAGTKKKRKR